MGVLEQARINMDALWRGRYTCPNPRVYPWQWLWDSCFNAVVLTSLNSERCITEMRELFSLQAESGFIPHMGYQLDPGKSLDLWGIAGRSTITQPPMYGHAIRVMRETGFDVGEHLPRAASRGLEWLFLNRSMSGSGLLRIVHPWESGVDDSPRWDDWADGAATGPGWRSIKEAMVRNLSIDSESVAVGSSMFEVASVGFNALVAFNALELADVTGDRSLIAAAEAIIDALVDRWDPGLATWVDPGPSASGSGRVRTLDALLPVLVERDPVVRDAVFATLLDDAAFGGDCGPAGVHRDEPTFAARTYWRGPAWPQLTYLFWVAACRHGRADDARRLADMLVRGAERSGWAEYWDADDGTGLGAAPQSWAALAAVVV